MNCRLLCSRSSRSSSFLTFPIFPIFRTFPAPQDNSFVCRGICQGMRGKNFATRWQWFKRQVTRAKPGNLFNFITSQHASWCCFAACAYLCTFATFSVPIFHFHFPTNLLLLFLFLFGNEIYVHILAILTLSCFSCCMLPRINVNLSATGSKHMSAPSISKYIYFCFFVSKSFLCPHTR